MSSVAEIREALAKLSTAELREVEEALRSQYRSRKGPLLHETNFPNDADWQAFRAALPQLLQTHPRQYVAILKGRVIDSDQHEFQLAERVARAHPDQRILIQRVVDGGWEDFHCETPDFETAGEPL